MLTKVFSFPFQVDFTFDKAVMSGILKESRDMLLKLVNTHLTQKSHGRINHVFNHYADPELLTQLYNPAGPSNPTSPKSATGLTNCWRTGRYEAGDALTDFYGFGMEGHPWSQIAYNATKKWLTDDVELQYNIWNSVAVPLMNIRSLSGLIVLTQPQPLPERAQIKCKNIWTIFFKLWDSSCVGWRFSRLLIF